MSTLQKKRLKIFVGLALQKDLSRLGGDVLNETECYRKMSSFADVFYNGQLIQWDEPNYGIEARELSIPDETFDLYYLRNSPHLYNDCPGPLMIMGHPYDANIWKMVDGIVVTNYFWKNYLQTYNDRTSNRLKKDPWYPDSIVQPKHIVVLEQSITPQMRPQRNSTISKLYRYSFGDGFNIGYLGRIDPTSYPYHVTEAIKEIRSKDNRVTFTFLGNIRDVTIPDWIQIYYRQPIERMPDVVSAFDCLIYDQDDGGHYLGSNKCLEAMACGVPILVRRHGSRIEQLGQNYPLYYDSTEEAESLIVKLKDDQNFSSQISQYLLERSSYFFRESVAQRIKDEVHAFLKS